MTDGGDTLFEVLKSAWKGVTTTFKDTEVMPVAIVVIVRDRNSVGKINFVRARSVLKMATTRYAISCSSLSVEPLR